MERLSPGNGSRASQSGFKSNPPMERPVSAGFLLPDYNSFKMRYRWIGWRDFVSKAYRCTVSEQNPETCSDVLIL
jgi:hypothetical protein